MWAQCLWQGRPRTGFARLWTQSERPGAPTLLAVRGSGWRESVSRRSVSSGSRINKTERPRCAACDRTIDTYSQALAVVARPTVGRPKALTDAQIRQAQQLRASGEPMPEIATTLGVARCCELSGR